jgi:hypothetical protein
MEMLATYFYINVYENIYIKNIPDKMYPHMSFH